MSKPIRGSVIWRVFRLIDMEFQLIETCVTHIDYVWFDTSRFSALNSCGHSPEAVLSAFTESPVFARSFCETTDPWGSPIGRHGPFLLNHFQVDWYSEIPAAELQSIMRSSLHDAMRTYDDRLDVHADHLTRINEWADFCHTNTAWRLDAPDDESSRVDFAKIWWAFDEFVVYNAASSELSIAVIGVD